MVRGAILKTTSGLLSLALLLPLLLTGCGEAPSGPPGRPPGLKPPGPTSTTVKPPVKAPVAKPPTVAVQPPAQPSSDPAEKQPEAESPDSQLASQKTSIQKNGFEISLAAEILKAGANPFLSRLPVPMVTVTAAGGEEPAASTPVAGTFDGISLLGVVFSPKKPVALLSVDGGEQSSQVVQKGDILFSGGGQVKVASIEKDSVVLESVGPSKETHTLTLPDIIGYASDGVATVGDEENFVESDTVPGVVKLPSGVPQIKLQEL